MRSSYDIDFDDLFRLGGVEAAVDVAGVGINGSALVISRAIVLGSESIKRVNGPVLDQDRGDQ
jgi:hypothetical protein